MAAGTTRALAPHTVGYESNEVVDNGIEPGRPGQAVHDGRSHARVPARLRQHRHAGDDHAQPHALPGAQRCAGLQRGLGPVDLGTGRGARLRVRPASRPTSGCSRRRSTCFADMGVQPATLMAGLAAGDEVHGHRRPDGHHHVAGGKRHDRQRHAAHRHRHGDGRGGGRVAGVEVSTNGGDTWHPATGTASWTYTYDQKGMGSTAIRVRATDDSANTGAVVTRNVTVQCPCSIFGAEVPPVACRRRRGRASSSACGSRPPRTASSPACASTREPATAAPTRVRSGARPGRCWPRARSPTRRRPAGRRCASPPPSRSRRDRPTSRPTRRRRVAMRSEMTRSRRRRRCRRRCGRRGIRRPAGGRLRMHREPSRPRATTAPTTTSTCCSRTVDDSPLTATDQWPIAGSSSVARSTTIRATFSKPIQAGTAAVIAEGRPGPDRRRQHVVRRRHPHGDLHARRAARRLRAATPRPLPAPTPRASRSPPARPGASAPPSRRPTPGVCPCSLFDDETTPTVLEDSDRNAVTLGVRFSSQADGTVSAIRFYKGPNNTGTHTGSAVVGVRHAAGDRHVHRRDHVRLADAHVRRSR